MLLDRLTKEGVAQPPKWLPANTHYLTQMGSVAYGVSGESSDVDVVGFCFPPKDQVFPWITGAIPGFGPKPECFGDWQQHHMQSSNGREYDVTVYGIVKFFDLAMGNNPNMVDSLFVPARCILHTTAVGDLVRQNRRLFLHKGCYHKFRGYAYAQLGKLKSRTLPTNPKRAALVEQFGFDTKHGYHVCRLALEAEQILVEGDLDLERNRELLKAIRAGAWTLDQLGAWFTEKEKTLERLAETSTLPHSAPIDQIKSLLLQCLEHHYGTVSMSLVRETNIDTLLAEMQQVITKYAA